MGERKVLNKYYPPDFDPNKIPKRKQLKNLQMKVRMMLPMSIRCNTCGTYMYKGTKFNCRKEDVQGDTYLGLLKFRFYFKCTKCSAELVMKTDPKNSDYEMEFGANRNFEPWREADEVKAAVKKQREEEEMGDAMKALENRTMDSKMEMDILAALDEMKSMRARQAAVDPQEVLQALKRSMEGEAAALQQQREKTEAELEEEDERLVKSIVFRNSANFVRRIEDDDDDDDNEDDNDDDEDDGENEDVKDYMEGGRRKLGGDDGKNQAGSSRLGTGAGRSSSGRDREGKGSLSASGGEGLNGGSRSDEEDGPSLRGKRLRLRSPSPSALAAAARASTSASAIGAGRSLAAGRVVPAVAKMAADGDDEEGYQENTGGSDDHKDDDDDDEGRRAREQSQGQARSRTDDILKSARVRERGGREGSQWGDGDSEDGKLAEGNGNRKPKSDSPPEIQQALSSDQLQRPEQQLRQEQQQQQQQQQQRQQQEQQQRLQQQQKEREPLWHGGLRPPVAVRFAVVTKKKEKVAEDQKGSGVAGPAKQGSSIEKQQGFQKKRMAGGVEGAAGTGCRDGAMRAEDDAERREREVGVKGPQQPVGGFQAQEQQRQQQQQKQLHQEQQLEHKKQTQGLSMLLSTYSDSDGDSG